MRSRPAQMPLSVTASQIRIKRAQDVPPGEPCAAGRHRWEYLGTWAYWAHRFTMLRCPDCGWRSEYLAADGHHPDMRPEIYIF